MARESKDTQEAKETIVEHLGELRKRIMIVLVMLIIGLIGGMLAANVIISYLKQVEPASSIDWNAFSPWDSLRIYMNVSLAVAAVLTLPVALYQIWAFVKPGLRKEEQRTSLMYVPGAFFLALLGISFGYFLVFPMAFKFTSFLTRSLGLVETYGAAQYFSFMFNIILPLALLFELPLVVMFLTKLRIMNPRMMHKFRRFAYFILFVISALITPPDVISAVIVSIPLMILYEISVLLSRTVYRKQQEADRHIEEMLGKPY
jgi:sec-independent protein translocase protein TatC